jgi:hypothetical protein
MMREDSGEESVPRISDHHDGDLSLLFAPRMLDVSSVEVTPVAD